MNEWCSHWKEFIKRLWRWLCASAWVPGTFDIFVFFSDIWDKSNGIPVNCFISHIALYTMSPQKMSNEIECCPWSLHIFFLCFLEIKSTHWGCFACGTATETELWHDHITEFWCPNSTTTSSDSCRKRKDRRGETCAFPKGQELKPGT